MIGHKNTKNHKSGLTISRCSHDIALTHPRHEIQKYGERRSGVLPALSLNGLYWENSNAKPCSHVRSEFGSCSIHSGKPQSGILTRNHIFRRFGIMIVDAGKAMGATHDRIHRLPCWNGRIEIAPLKGGISNESFVVNDAAGRHVVRFGKDYPFHHVFRDRELMTARAAHEAGFAPRVEYAQTGVMVTEFLGAKTYAAEDVVANRSRIAELVRRFHREMARHLSGAGFMFWAFHVIRDYARTLEIGGSRMVEHLPGYLALAEELEAAQMPLPIVFGHNDLLPSNFLDDGKRLWLIDFEYAGFSTAMFDLAGVTSNAGFDADQSEDFLTTYFEGPPDQAVRRSFAAMQCASLLREAMWSMVSELHLSAPGADYVAYTTENLTRLDAALEHYRKHYGKHSS